MQQNVARLLHNIAKRTKGNKLCFYNIAKCISVMDEGLVFSGKRLYNRKIYKWQGGRMRWEISVR